MVLTIPLSTQAAYTWTEQNIVSHDINWYDIASDSDGSNLIASASNGRLYTSSDSGVSWTERQPAGDGNKGWKGVASDSDGSHLVASYYNGYVYTSADSGATWTQSSTYGRWEAVASDDDGTNLIAAAYSRRLYQLG